MKELSGDIEDVKQTQTELLMRKTTMSEMENMLL